MVGHFSGDAAHQLEEEKLNINSFLVEYGKLVGELRKIHLHLAKFLKDFKCWQYLDSGHKYI